ncbi:energy-coupling factor transporter transmembrane protein EcfT [Alkalihalobacillus sp. AL-G]|uniref:energy-coupling factor transporter transmembrane component T family protein n=1 Tax=Alkalihalobacillus sp. AL-G TaxID=2926399 RepID=UPI00272BF26D|nr:energy-coupling factor transporter transmembrane component T [Alkalihalobacillus sp. AL-G]WLD93581.1 energy-coupling factor transporter transmembrane protein EcfT [Alkalihalobacillus sp. AL-G]
MNSLFVQKDSLIHKLDPRTKIIFLLFVVISTFLLGDPAFQLVLLVFLLPIVFMSKLLKQYLISMQFLMLFVVLIMTVHGIYNPIGETVIWEIGSVSFKYESLVYASVMSFRILVIGTGAVLFVMTTHPSDLAAALIKWKVPHSAAFMLLSTFQIIPIIAREAKIVMEAQQARCLDVKGSVIQRVKSLIPLFAPLFIITFMKVHQLSYVLECRGFSTKGKKTSLRESKISKLDYIFLSGLLLALVGEIYLRLVTSGALTLTTDVLLISSLITVWVVCGILAVKFLYKRVHSWIGGWNV